MTLADVLFLYVHRFEKERVGVYSRVNDNKIIRARPAQNIVFSTEIYSGWLFSQVMPKIIFPSSCNLRDKLNLMHNIIMMINVNAGHASCMINRDSYIYSAAKSNKIWGMVQHVITFIFKVTCNYLGWGFSPMRNEQNSEPYKNNENEVSYRDKYRLRKIFLL